VKQSKSNAVFNPFRHKVEYTRGTLARLYSSVQKSSHLDESGINLIVDIKLTEVRGK